MFKIAYIWILTYNITKLLKNLLINNCLPPAILHLSFLEVIISWKKVKVENLLILNI